MRDNHHNMIELLEASRAEGCYSSLIRSEVGGEDLKLRFGIETADFFRLKRILEFRPFEHTGVAPYRYFFALSYRYHPDNEEIALVSVRVEQLDRHKQFEFELGKKFIANLLWFINITNKSEISHLIES